MSAVQNYGKGRHLRGHGKRGNNGVGFDNVCTTTIENKEIGDTWPFWRKYAVVSVKKSRLKNDETLVAYLPIHIKSEIMKKFGKKLLFNKFLITRRFASRVASWVENRNKMLYWKRKVLWHRSPTPTPPTQQRKVQWWQGDWIYIMWDSTKKSSYLTDADRYNDDTLIILCNCIYLCIYSSAKKWQIAKSN